jgi:hypothetical protein
MCTKKKSNKSTHLCENRIVKVKANKRSVCTIGRSHNSMVEEEGSSASMSTKSEKDTFSLKYLLETLATEEDEDEDINVSRKVTTPQTATSTMKEGNKPILICVYSC